MKQFLRALRFSSTVLMSALLPYLTTAQEAFVMKANGGEYPVIAALFGEPGYCNASGYTAEWVIALDTVAPVTDACQAPMNDLFGKIALVDRGMCSFDSKCLKVQQAGAIAVIVCNNSDLPPIAMGVASPSVSALINIPCFMASKQDCDVLRLLTPLEISVVPVYPKFPKAKVLWGKYAGQGDFRDGLNGWTVQNATCSNGVEDFETWRWDADGVLDNSPFSEGPIAIHAPTACNGAAFFDSALYDATSQPACQAPQSGELVSPVINLSNAGVPGVSLQFFQVVRNRNSRFFVGYSTDGGNTWTETAINTDLEINGPSLNNIQKIPLPGLAGSPQARFKFRMEGDYFYWMIDDVRIIEQEHNNLSLNKNFYAIPPNYATPYNLVEPIHFLTDVSNIGSVTQTNTTLKMTVLNAQNQQVFQETQSFGQLLPNTTLNNVLLNESFEPDLVGTYRGTYRVSADAPDSDKSNNQASFEFKVTEGTWAKEAGATRSVCPDATAWEPGESHSWTFGNHFFTPELQNFNVSVSSVSFSIDNSQNSGAAAGEVVLVAVYEWVDANNDGKVQDAERVGITFGAYAVEGDETASDLITIPLNDIVLLESNAHYLVMLQYTAPDALTDLWVAASDAFDYNAMIYLHSQEVLDMPRYASFMAIGELATATYVPSGFGTDIVPVIRLHSGFNVALDRQASSNTLTVFPNPAKDMLHVACKFEQPAQDVGIRVVDATGKTVYQEQKGDSDWNNFNLDIGHLSSGIYHLLATSEHEESSCRFAVVK